MVLPAEGYQIWTDEAPTRPPFPTPGGERLSLQDQISDDSENLILNAANRREGFSIAAEYTPVGGVARVIEVVIEEDAQTDLDNLGDEEVRDRILVFCLRDDELGIDAPRLQDQLLPTGETRPYVYSGEVVSKHQSAWVLRFWRVRVTGRGVR
jgi:hypothetical protein